MHHTSGNESNKFYLIIRKAKKTQFHLGCPTIDFRFLRIFVRLEALIKNIFQGGAR